MSADCERPGVYRETFPRARKAHQCCECDAPIEAGEEHLYVCALWEGLWDRARQHMLCRQLCMLMNADADDCFAFGELKDTWTDGDWGDRSNRVEFREARTLYARILRRERAFARAVVAA